ncbi:MAG: HipA N-terminal domain-containing protein [Bacteroidota bacterium]
MTKSAEVYYNETLSGYLSKTSRGYIFEYADNYYLDNTKPALSLTLPKTQKVYYSEKLFSFFYGLLSEGDLKTIQCRVLGINENDHFTRLIKTASNTIGAVKIKEVNDEQMS